MNTDWSTPAFAMGGGFALVRKLIIAPFDCPPVLEAATRK